MAAGAAARDILRDVPMAGDICLHRSPVARRFIRAGVVGEVRGSGRYDRRAVSHDPMPIDASTDEVGRIGGRHVLRVARRCLPTRGDRFIRWAELDDDVDAGGRESIGRILARVVPGVETAEATPHPRRAEGGGMTVRQSHLTLTRGGQSQGDSARSVEHIWARVERPVRRVARRLTDDPECQKDLGQDAMIRRWEFDPSRIDERNDVAFFDGRRLLVNRMREVVRSEWARVFVPPVDRQAG